MRYFVIVIIVLFPCMMFADDTIIMRSGQDINAIVLEINKKEIKYKKATNPNGPIYVVEVADVASIKYANGETDEFDLVITQGELPIIPTSNNQDLIRQYNAEIPVFKDKTSKGKPAKQAFMYLGLGDNSVVSTNDFEIEIFPLNVYRQQYNSRYNLRRYNFRIKNKTDRPIYIDLGNSFSACSKNHSEAMGQPLYTFDTYTESQGIESGGSIGLGALTGVLGIGGVVGAVANGISVGGSNQNGVSINKSTQRIIAVPPRSSLELPGHPYEEEKEVKYDYFNFGDHRFNYIYLGETLNLNKWEIKQFDFAESPFRLTYYFTLSKEKDFKTFQLVPINIYARAIYAGPSIYDYENLKEMDYYKKTFEVRNPNKFLFGVVSL